MGALFDNHVCYVWSQFCSGGGGKLAFLLRQQFVSVFLNKMFTLFVTVDLDSFIVHDYH